MQTGHVSFLTIACALLAGPIVEAAWWEQPHDHWHVKDDWKAAAVDRYSHSMTLQSPARDGWIVIWGDEGVDLSVNDRPLLGQPDARLVYDTNLADHIRGALEIHFQAGPGRIVAEGEILDDQGRIYPFASGCDWPGPVPAGTDLPAAADAHRPEVASGADRFAPLGRPLRYNEAERSKSDIARTLARIQRLRDQSSFLLRRWRHAQEILSFDPGTLWRRAERFASRPILEAERLVRDDAVPAQRRSAFREAGATVQQAGIRLAAAELALSSAQALYQLERHLSHLEACLQLIRDADLQPPSLDSHFTEIRTYLRAARNHAALDDWAGVDKQNRTAQPRLEALHQLLTELWGHPISQLDQFPADPLGWLNHPSLMGNDPAGWGFSVLPLHVDQADDPQIESVTTPGPLSLTTELVIHKGDQTECLTFFSSAMSPGVVVASDQPVFRLRGWETRGHATPRSIAFVASDQFQAVSLEQPGFSLEGATLSASWLVLGPGAGSAESGLTNTRPTMLVMEQRPHLLSWDTNSLGHLELTMVFARPAGRVMIFTPPFDDPPWTHQDAFIRARTLRSVPVACSQLVRVHPGRSSADHLLRYHYFELEDFAGHGAVRVAPVPMLVAYAFEHDYPGLSSRGFSTTSYRSDHANYRLRLFWDTFDYTVPLLDRSAFVAHQAQRHSTPPVRLASHIAWFHRIEPIDATGETPVFQSQANQPKPYRDQYYPGYQATPESAIDALLEPILYSIRTRASLHCREFAFSSLAPGGDHLRQLHDQLGLFNRFGIRWDQSAWRGDDPLPLDRFVNHNEIPVDPARAILRTWTERHPATPR